MERHASPGQGAGSALQHDAAAGGYFGVLASLLLGAMLWSLRRGFVLPVTRTVRPSPARCFMLASAPLPRGPTLALLQVIRQ